jgi:type II secretory pathway pseudopilin PulG
MSARIAKAEGGFTLIELLIASFMMVVITGAAVTMLISVMHREPAVSGRANQIGNARNAIETITGDLRGGVRVTAAGPSQITVLTTACGQGGGTECSVSYVCAGETAKRTYECAREKSGRISTLITGLASPNIFCFYPNRERGECGEAGSLVVAAEAPTYVGLKLQFPQEHNERMNSILESGVALHNSPSVLSGTAPAA